MTIKLARYAEILPEFEEMLPGFYAEVDIYPDKPEPNFNHGEFLALEEAGLLQTVITEEEEVFLGIHVSVIRPDIYYQHILTGYVMFYNLLKSARGRGLGKAMFEFAEKVMKEKGVKRIYASRKTHIQSAKMFDDLGYRSFEDNRTKYIGQEDETS